MTTDTRNAGEEWRLVPVHATDDMMDAGVETAQRQMPPSVKPPPGYVQMRAAWAAMIAAAPALPTPNTGERDEETLHQEIYKAVFNELESQIGNDLMGPLARAVWVGTQKAARALKSAPPDLGTTTTSLLGELATGDQRPSTTKEFYAENPAGAVADALQVTRVFGMDKSLGEIFEGADLRMFGASVVSYLSQYGLTISPLNEASGKLPDRSHSETSCDLSPNPAGLEG